MVDATQPGGAPLQVSRTKTSACKLVSPATRLVAWERKVTKGAPALMEGAKLRRFPGLPSFATDTRVVDGTQSAGPPTHLSRTKTSPIVPAGTSSVESEVKATKRPPGLIEDWVAATTLPEGATEICSMTPTPPAAGSTLK